MSEFPIVTDSSERKPEEGIALCISGGGYRAMLFHLGVLWYLNDARYLQKLARISSVSGGSITSATLATRWPKLDFDANGVARAFVEQVVKPIQKLAGETIDVRAGLTGIFTRGSIADKVRDAYKKHLFGNMRLDEIQATPRFVINATNVQTGSLMRFSQKSIADYMVGEMVPPRKLVAEAVAASSAFPPVLSPLELKFAPGELAQFQGPTGLAPLNRPPFTTKVALSDGGVYDNMGIETAWKRYSTILVSDAGAKLQPEEDVAANWASHSLRVNSLIDNQVRSLRKRQVVSSLAAGVRKGAYWGMRSEPNKYPTTSALALPADARKELAEVKTRLAKLDTRMQNRLINFGYAMAERGMRGWVDPNLFAPQKFPLPDGV